MFYLLLKSYSVVLAGWLGAFGSEGQTQAQGKLMTIEQVGEILGGMHIHNFLYIYIYIYHQISIGYKLILKFSSH